MSSTKFLGSSRRREEHLSELPGLKYEFSFIHHHHSKLAMEGAVANYAEGVAQAVVGKLGLLLSEEYRLLSGIRGHIVHLRDDVAIMNALLRMLSEADDGAVDHFVREWMKQVRELAYDTEDCIDFFVRRISYGGVWHLLATLRARHRLAADIQELQARAVAVGERRTRYGVDSHALRRSASLSSGTANQPAQALGAAGGRVEFVGIRDHVQRLTDLVRSPRVKSDGQADTTLKVFSVVGFGGLGKTTLAVEACRNLAEFDCQAMVSVSQAFDAGTDMARLLHHILQQVVTVNGEEDALGPIDTTDADSLTTMLRKRLQEKRYLIVIDDVWTISAWDAIRSKLPDENNSSRIIVTTRMENVARTCSPASDNAGGDYIHRPKPLKLEDSERLFMSRVFGPGNPCPDELRDAMDSILRKCGGLPLAIVSLASLLACHSSPGRSEIWTRVSNSIGVHMENNPTLEGMRKLITLSYNHLPHYLKAIMMYLSMFPEDYEINKDRLLKRWITEGLVPERRGMTPQQVAEDCYDELLSRSMVEPSRVGHDGTVTDCRVHDMMLEVVVSKALEDNFVSLVGGPCGGTWHDTIRRLSVQGDLSLGVAEMSMRHVRSLSTFRPTGQGRLLDRLAEFTLLRVLDLEGCKDLRNHHLKHICRLFLLRFLNLNYTDVTKLPSQIGDLRHLQTLWVQCTLINRFPGSLINLENLQHLSFYNRADPYRYVRLPRGLKKMKALVELRRLELRKGDAELAKEIGELVQLRLLRVNLNCRDCSEEQVLIEFGNSLGKLCSLRELCVEDMMQDMTVDANNLTFLHRLSSPPQLLQCLAIGGKIHTFPKWVKSLTHLTNIDLWCIDIPGDLIYGALCMPPNLLRISFDRRCCSDDQLVARTSFRFPALREMQFHRDDVPRVISFEQGSMVNLQKLRVCFWRGEDGESRRQLAGVEHLTGLKEVELVGWRGMKALDTAADQLRNESRRRQPESDQFKVIVKYE